MSTSAPDVDLKSRGLPQSLLLTGAAVAVGLALFFSRSFFRLSSDDADFSSGDAEEGEAAVSSGIVGWLLWTALRLAQMIFGIFAMLLAVLIARQRSILYVPVPPGTQRSLKDNPSMFRSPEAWRLPYKDVYITAEDGVRLHAWLVYQASPGSSQEDVPYTLLYFHGNAGNIGHRLENIRDMHRQLGVNVLILDYRGYGDSEDGDGPSEAGFMKDAAAAYRWLVEQARRPQKLQQSAGGDSSSARIRSDRLLFFGRSIGGAVAIRLAAQLLREQRGKALFGEDTGTDAALPLPAGLILENTFTSLRDMAVQVFPFLMPLRSVLRAPLIFDEWLSCDSLEYLASNHEHWCCCLLSGLQDQIVPPEQMKQLHAILKQHRPKVLKFFCFPNGGHNDTPQRGGPDYWASFKKYMDLVVSTEPERIEAAQAARS